jgi:hypothetical protein
VHKARRKVWQVGVSGASAPHSEFEPFGNFGKMVEDLEHGGLIHPLMLAGEDGNAAGLHWPDFAAGDVGHQLEGIHRCHLLDTPE